jgi:YidC/Oxa1 family membrane protein insertase
VLNFIYYPVSGILWVWHKVFSFILTPIFGAGSSGVSWALGVVFLVVTLRAVLFKPFVHQVRSMKKMQEFAPEIKKLQAKYKNDKQKLAQEMQKLQSEHGVNPLGGCLPMLVQMPIFIGLLQVLRSFNRLNLPDMTPELNRSLANYWVPAEDVQSFLDARFFGAPLSAYITEPDNLLTTYGVDFTRNSIIYVAVPLMIIASVATHFTSRHSVQRQVASGTSTPQTAIMNKLTMYVFPLGVLVGGAFFPIAVLMYWLSNNTWTLFQQRFVYRRIDREEDEKKQAAITQRQALAPKPGQKPQAGQKPKPGQKPVRPQDKVAKVEDTPPVAKAEDTPPVVEDTKPATSTAATNGKAPKSGGKDSTVVTDGEASGVTSDRSRGKKPNRKRR